MGRFAHAFGPDHPEVTYIAHAFPERTFDTGEVALNYAVAGSDDMPALLLIPGGSGRLRRDGPPPPTVGPGAVRGARGGQAIGEGRRYEGLSNMNCEKI